jgi:hypothetical protein
MTNPEFSSYEDHSHEPQPSYFVDRLSDEDWPEFCRQARAANELAVDYEPGTQQTAEWIVGQGSELRKVFGQGYIGKSSQVLGLAYTEQHIRTASADELIGVDAKSAIFKDVGMQYINKQWRVVLEFHVATPTILLKSGMYYIEPDSHLLEFTIDANFEDEDNDDDDEDEIPVAELMEQEAEKAQRQIAGKRFARRGPAEQRQMLDNIIISADLVIDAEQCNRNIAVESLRYYTVFDDMPEIALKDLYTDQTDTEPEERYSIEGVIHGFDYPELQHIPKDKLLTRKDFIYNDGAPCLVVRNDNLGCTYLVIPQSILDIT